MQNTPQSLYRNLNFGQALDAAKSGHAIRRAAWPAGCTIHVRKGAIDGDILPPATEPQPVLIHGMRASLFERWHKGIVTRIPNISMRMEDGINCDGWGVSHRDLLSEDWEVSVPEGEPAFTATQGESVVFTASVEKLLAVRVQALELSHQIERCGSSPELTEASKRAAALRQDLQPENLMA
ncbi:MAG: DUF2829 domain-containing protein [Verrucomicrobia bacterium]|nr:DUF2829 domain-containing protein [Verrucomicrobiota bacterium]